MNSISNGFEKYERSGATLYRGDSLAVLRSLPDKSVDLVFTSPPYENCRSYGELKFHIRGQEWVDWCVERFMECLRVCKGLVAWNVEGQTRKYRYSAAPLLLMADLHRRGVHLRKPPIFKRVGIPGSGGPDWLRNDYEFIVCGTSGGKLPWSDNTAMGHPPKWAPGGEMSHRLADGSRRDKWGSTGHASSGEGRKTNGLHKTRRDKRIVEKMAAGAKMHTKSKPDGTDAIQCYAPLTLANPGNIIELLLTLPELIDILIDYEQATHTTTDKVLRDLREADRSSSLREWFYGVCLQVQATTFLQHSMRGPAVQERESAIAEVRDVRQVDRQAEGRVDSRAPSPEVLFSQMPRASDGSSGRPQTRRASPSGSEDSETPEASGSVRTVRADQSAGSPPSGRGRDEQQPVKPASPVLVVPSQEPQDRRLQSDRMWRSPLCFGILQQALPTLQEVWRSVDSSFRNREASESGNIVHCKVGGGQMGSPLAHLNEAPFPTSFCEFFIRSFCPPGGVVLDPFCGSGTTIKVALCCNRKAIGIDIRDSQIDLTARRLKEVQRELLVI